VGSYSGFVSTLAAASQKWKGMKRTPASTLVPAFAGRTIDPRREVLLVHALHEKARQFYEHYGFQPSPTHPMTLMLRLSLSSVKA
jgi:hypothetical protein